MKKFIITGKIVNQNNAPLSGLIIEAWDKDLICDDLVGSTTSDSKGNFRFSFTSAYFSELFFDRKPDLFFKVFDGKQLVHDTRDEVLWNVDAGETEVIICVERDIPLTPPVVLDKGAILLLKKLVKQTPLLIQNSHPKLWGVLREKVIYTIHNELIQHYQKSNPKLKEYITALDFSKLSVEASVKEYVSNTIKNGNLTEDLKFEGVERLQFWKGTNSISELLQPETPVELNPFFQMELQQADIYQIGDLASFNDSIVEKLLGKNLSAAAIGPEKIGALVEEKIISESEGQNLNLNANIYAFANGNLSIANAIKNNTGGQSLTSLADLTPLSLDEWRNIVEAGGATNGSVQEQAAKYKRKIEILYPQRSFKARSKTLENPAMVELMDSFFEANPTVNFLNINYDINSLYLDQFDFGNASSDQQESILLNLKTNQRLYQITDDVEHVFLLKQNGYTAGYQIANDSYVNFKETNQLDESNARTYYDRALKDAVRVNIGFGNITDWINNPLKDSNIENISDSVGAYLERLNGYADFFGETALCKCKHCASIISPVAYFMDLMDFLNSHVMSAYFAGDPSTQHIISPQRRRPDLWSGLILNCKNTHELVPYLTIINEILENFIYAQAHDLDGELLPERTEIEKYVYLLLAMDASDPLVVHSFKQPFHLSLTELEIYLQHFPITRHSIATTLLSYVADADKVLPQSSLKLSARQYELIQNNRSADEAFLKALYNISDSGRISRFNVQDLLQVIEISRSDLSIVLGTYFINAGGSPILEVVGYAEGGSLQVTSEYLVNTTASEGIPFEVLDRIHRFIRLWRQVDWTFEELDLTIKHLHQSMGATGDGMHDLWPERIGKLIEVQKDLEINVNQLCAFIHRLPAEGDSAYFDQRFNLKAFLKEERDRWTPPQLMAGRIQFQHPSFKEIATSNSEETTLLHRILAGLGINDEELSLLIENLSTPLSAPLSGSDRGTFILNLESLSLIYRHALILKKYNLSVSELFFLLRIAPDISHGYLSNIEDTYALIEVLNWQKESAYSITQLAFILDNPINDTLPLETPEVMASHIWNQIQEEQSLLFKDTIFSYIQGISETQSKAVVKANAPLIVPADLRKYRAAAATKQSATFNLNIPVTINDRLSSTQRTQIIGASLAFISEAISGSRTTIGSDFLSTIDDLSSDDSLEILNQNTRFFVVSSDGSGDFEVTAATLNDPTELNIVFPPAIWTALTEEVQRELYSIFVEILSRFIQPGAPELSDRQFVGIGDLNLAQSRDIIAANSTFFESIENENLFWLSPDFDFNGSITIPVDIPLTSKQAMEMLTGRHVGKIIPNALSARLDVSSEKIKALGKLGGYDFEDTVLSTPLTMMAQGTGSMADLLTPITLLQKLSNWFGAKVFEPSHLKFISDHSGGEMEIFKIALPNDFRNPSLQHLRDTEDYRLLLQYFNDKVTPLHTVLEGYEFGAPEPKFAITTYASISNLLEVEVGIVNNLNDTLGAARLFPVASDTGGTSNLALKALHKFMKAMNLVQNLGIGPEALPLFISNDFEDLSLAVKTVVTAIRTKYNTEEAWEESITPFEDKIREYRRDGLTDYLLHNFRSTLTADSHWFRTTNDLYNYFLIDTELEGCARTSRVVAGISSLQLYVQRCLLNLERTEIGITGEIEIHVRPNDIPANQWAWRKNYRVWEANRKVFLYPENYIEPDLRDNKTDLFKDLESELLQQEITSNNALGAYSKYMKGFEEIATLSISGSYHDLGAIHHKPSLDKTADTLHLFGVTNSEPPVHYYRTIDNLFKREKDSKRYGVKYHPWQKLSLQIPVRKVSPIVFEGRLYLFWTEIQSIPKTEGSRLNRYEHKPSFKYVSLEVDGGWSAPQTIQFKEHPKIMDNLVSPEEWSQFNSAIAIYVHNAPEYDSRKIREIYNEIHIDKVENDYQLWNTGFWEEVAVQAKLQLDERYNSNPELFKTAGEIKLNITIKGDEDPKERILSFSIPRNANNIKALYAPIHDPETIHLKPQDDYSLKGYDWERIFPDDFKKNLFIRNNVLPRSLAVNLSSREVYVPRVTVGFSGITNENRLQLTNGRLSFVNGWLPLYYYDGEQILHNDYDDLTSRVVQGPYNVARNINGENVDVSLTNGQLSSAVVKIDGDVFLLYNHWSFGQLFYILNRLGSTRVGDLSRKLFTQGIDGLLDVDYQKSLKEGNVPFSFLLDDLYNDAKTAIDKGIPDFKGSLGTYFRESFFHIPYLIANHLNSQGKYADAQRWYHYIFDPTSNKFPDDLDSISEPEELKRRMADRVWQFIEFRDHTLATWYERLNDAQAIEAYENDPFNPHAIARLRLGAYMKNITMKYIDNLLDWGDHLFGQDTMESINEATLLYTMASEILGPRPAELGDCSDKSGENPTYNDLYTFMNSAACGNFLKEVESAGKTNSERAESTETVPLYLTNFIIFDTQMILDAYYAGNSEDNTSEESTGNNGMAMNEIVGLDGPVLEQPPVIENEWVIPPNLHIDLGSFHTSFLKQACLFCIPPNPDLLAYWDRVADRLFKIRNCMNISGVKRQISLFAPEIDPRLLVRARAAGLSLEDILGSIQGDLPPYRFAFLLAKAKEYAGALQAYGGALLGAMEKKSAEELSLLRMSQQNEILKMTSQLRDMEIEAAEESLEGLTRRKESIQFKKDYYQELVDEGLTELEIAQDTTYYTGLGTKAVASVIAAIATGLSMPPSILGFSFSTPTDGIKEGLINAANVINGLGELQVLSSQVIGKHANYERRQRGWKFTVEQATNELAEIEKQIVAATIRKEISVKSREVHEKSMEHHTETYEFYRDKFTNHGLYTWLSTQLQRMFREAYQNAMTIARMAERAYRFERNDDTSVLLDGNYWEGSRAGLLSGEKLMNALRGMELRYMETNKRSMEIDQAFSLMQVDPEAILRLKQTGECEFTIPEMYFDLFYPGQYRRRIKSARLTIPCITGPYSNVSSVLTLKSSYIRKEARLDEGSLTLVPPSRSTTVATSTAQNDGGVFRLDFRDERYMPFEGAGAVESTWKLELPKNFRPFDYATINDAIIHISYTAEYDTKFREEVEGITGRLESLLTGEDDFQLQRLFSLRQEFSQTFHRLLHSQEGEIVPLELSEKHFPLFLQGKSLEISEAQLILEIDENGFRDEDGVLPPPMNSISVGINLESNGSTASAITSFNKNPSTGIYTASLNTDAFSNFLPVHEALRINFSILDAGELAPIDSPPSDPSALDSHKIKDLYIGINYRVVTS